MCHIYFILYLYLCLARTCVARLFFSALASLSCFTSPATCCPPPLLEPLKNCSRTHKRAEAAYMSCKGDGSESFNLCENVASAILNLLLYGRTEGTGSVPHTDAKH